MSDAAILYTGMLCFALIMTAFVLTIWEFKKMERGKAGSGNAPPPPRVVDEAPMGTASVKVRSAP